MNKIILFLVTTIISHSAYSLAIVAAEGGHYLGTVGGRVVGGITETPAGVPNPCYGIGGCGFGMIVFTEQEYLNGGVPTDKYKRPMFGKLGPSDVDYANIKELRDVLPHLIGQAQDAVVNTGGVCVALIRVFNAGTQYLPGAIASNCARIYSPPTAPCFVSDHDTQGLAIDFKNISPNDTPDPVRPGYLYLTCTADANNIGISVGSGETIPLTGGAKATIQWCTPDDAISTNRGMCGAYGEIGLSGVHKGSATPHLMPFKVKLTGYKGVQAGGVIQGMAVIMVNVS